MIKGVCDAGKIDVCQMIWGWREKRSFSQPGLNLAIKLGIWREQSAERVIPDAATLGGGGAVLSKKIILAYHMDV